MNKALHGCVTSRLEIVRSIIDVPVHALLRTEQLIGVGVGVGDTDDLATTEILGVGVLPGETAGVGVADEAGDGDTEETGDRFWSPTIKDTVEEMVETTDSVILCTREDIVFWARDITLLRKPCGLSSMVTIKDSGDEDVA